MEVAAGTATHAALWARQFWQQPTCFTPFPLASSSRCAKSTASCGPNTPSKGGDQESRCRRELVWRCCAQRRFWGQHTCSRKGRHRRLNLLSHCLLLGTLRPVDSHPLQTLANEPPGSSQAHARSRRPRAAGRRRANCPAHGKHKLFHSSTLSTSPTARFTHPRSRRRRGAETSRAR